MNAGTIKALGYLWFSMKNNFALNGGGGVGFV